MADSSQSVTRTVPIKAADLFAVLADPGRHPAIDGSGMVRRAATTERITKVGDVFRMGMNHPASGEYQTDNHVVEFEEPRRIAWASGSAGGQPAGWRWIWELHDEGDSTTITHTYDWSRVTDAGVLNRVSFPVVSAEQMARSIELLTAAAS